VFVGHCGLDQIGDAELLAAQLFIRGSVRILRKVRVTVSQYDPRERLRDDAAAHGTETNWGIVLLESLLRFRKDVEPQGSVILKLPLANGADVRTSRCALRPDAEVSPALADMVHSVRRNAAYSVCRR
jgi:hypothetical protein